MKRLTTTPAQLGADRRVAGLPLPHRSTRPAVLGRVGLLPVHPPARSTRSKRPPTRWTRCACRRSSTSSTRAASTVSRSRRRSSSASAGAGSGTRSRSTADSTWRSTARAAQAAGVQRRHADVAAGGGGHPVVLVQGRLQPQARPVQLHPRAADRGLETRGRAAADRRRGTSRRCSGVLEDYMTVTYLRDTAMQAGLETEYIDVEQIGWNCGRRAVRRRAERHDRQRLQALPVGVDDPRAVRPATARAATRPLAGAAVEDAPEQQGDPAGALGAVPRQPLPAAGRLRPAAGPYVRKPMLGREGAQRPHRHRRPGDAETDGPYGGGPCVYQALHPITEFDGNYPVVGSWMVNGYACGIGVREDTRRSRRTPAGSCRT